MDCNCPAPEILEAIPTSNCDFKLEQIQKLIFATKNKVVWSAIDSAGSGGVPVADAQLDDLADWQARLTATDSSKMIITPSIGGDPIIESGEPITEGGGDNTTLNGVEEISGVNPSNFSAFFRNISTAQENALKKIACTPVEVYYVLQFGRIAVRKKKIGDSTDTTYGGFEVQALFVSDKNNQGFGTDDRTQIRFSMPSGWSEGLEIVKPNFNPLTQL